MGLSDDLRQGVGARWQQVVEHPFIIELGEGTLDSAIFNVYFDQDYLFLKDWVILLSTCAAKSPDFGSARQVVGFLHLGLGGEESLFQRAFRERGMSSPDVESLAYLPTTQSYSGYLRTLAYEGTFLDVVATLLAVEWPYLDWAMALDAAGKHPENYYYQTWIDVHTSQGMREFVGWLRRTVDEATVTPAQAGKLQSVFQNVLRYEFQFFDMAYRGERWPE